MQNPTIDQITPYRYLFMKVKFTMERAEARKEHRARKVLHTHPKCFIHKTKLRSD